MKTLKFKRTKFGIALFFNIEGEDIYLKQKMAFAQNKHVITLFPDILDAEYFVKLYSKEGKIIINNDGTWQNTNRREAAKEAWKDIFKADEEYEELDIENVSEENMDKLNKMGLSNKKDIMQFALNLLIKTVNSDKNFKILQKMAPTILDVREFPIVRHTKSKTQSDAYWLLSSLYDTIFEKTLFTYEEVVKEQDRLWKVFQEVEKMYGDSIELVDLNPKSHKLHVKGIVKLCFILYRLSKLVIDRDIVQIKKQKSEFTRVTNLLHKKFKELNMSLLPEDWEYSDIKALEIAIKYLEEMYEILRTCTNYTINLSDAFSLRNKTVLKDIDEHFRYLSSLITVMKNDSKRTADLWHIKNTDAVEKKMVISLGTESEI